MAGVLYNMKKMDFCRTLHSEVRLNTNLISAIENCLRECIGVLDSHLAKISTKEEIEAMNKKFEAQMEQRNKEFKQFTD